MKTVLFSGLFFGVEGTDDFGGDAGDEGSWGDVFVDYRAGGDDCAVTDCYAGENGYICAEPNVVADFDVLVELKSARSFFGDSGVGCGDNCDVRTEHTTVADIDFAVVDESEIEVGVEVVADVDVSTAEI